MEIGIGLLEYMCFAAMATGIFWLAARLLKHKHEKAGRKPVWVSWGAEFFGVIALVLFCRVAVADWHQVPSGSMEPTIRVGDKILVNKLAYGPRLPFTNTSLKLGEPERGDVVVFRYPRDVSVLYVKRLIGLPGDLVTYNHGAVRINNEAFQITIDDAVPQKPEDSGHVFMHETAGGRMRTIKLNSYMAGSAIFPEAWLREYKDVCAVQSAQEWQCTVPQGKYLMMGDNRDNSADSRVWGFLDAKQVYGKAMKVIINFSDLGRFWTSL